jgi:hypothetical protein
VLVEVPVRVLDVGPVALTLTQSRPPGLTRAAAADMCWCACTRVPCWKTWMPTTSS